MNQNVEIELEQWLQEETPEVAIDIMREDAVVPFGTALWPR